MFQIKNQSSTSISLTKIPLGKTMGHWKLKAKIKDDVPQELKLRSSLMLTEWSSHCLIYLLACSLCTASNKLGMMSNN